MRVVALLAGSLIVLLTEVPAGQRTASPPGPDFSPVREFIKTEMGVGTSTPSLAVAVARGNEILWEEGFGWIDHPGGTAATVDTLYYVASVTKAITATALMVLHERRQVELDRPANLYLRTAKLRSPHWNADDVTIRHLATHTGGLATYDNRDDIPGNETIRRYGIVFTPPGESFDYSNLGFGILGQIIADVSGRSFQAFVHDEVLRPLAMVNAWAGATPKSPHPVAPRYSSQLKTFSPPLTEPRLPGSSVLYCSAHELALFGMFHLKVPHPRQKAILSDAAIDGLREPAVAAGERRQSLAWSITDNQHGYRTLLAQGGTYDSQAWLLLVPSERIVVVVLANAGNVAVSSAIDRILSVMLPVYRENLDSAVAPGSGGTAPATISPSGVPLELVGAWSGEIHTHRGNVPLAVAITSSGDVTATLGKQPPVNMTDVRTRNDRVIGRMHGDLGVDYVGTAPYQLRFALRRVGNKLVGSAITYAADLGRLPLWVELRRGENK
jgi:CubicO group peptidase (beta-lactamase class C family)